MMIVAIKWNHNGSVLALVGTLVVDGDIKESNVLQLYSPFGEVSFLYYNCHYIINLYVNINLKIIISFLAFENP